MGARLFFGLAFFDDFGEHHAAGRSLQVADEFDFDFLVDASVGVVDDDHGTIWEMANALFGAAAGAGDFKKESFAGEVFLADGEGEIVDIEDIDMLGGGSAIKVVIVGKDEAIVLLGEVNKTVVDRGVVELVVVNGDGGELDAL